MDIFHRFTAFIIFVYVTAKFLTVVAIILHIIAVTALHEGTADDLMLLAFLIVPLIVLSIIEWILFGKFIWSYYSFKPKDEESK